MRIPKRRVTLVTGTGVVAILLALAVAQLPAAGAGGLLHPMRTRVARSAPPECRDATFAGDAVMLKGWRCESIGARLGTVVYLHGIADNRASAAGVVGRFVTRGFDLVAYDSRAHGESEGAACTYGFFEKNDLRRILDTVEPGPIVLVGTSLGAAVALQEAAIDPRVTAVVAAETFSDLRTVATERAPFFFTRRLIERAFRLAERQARFQVDAVSPVSAASAITIPVLLIHGEADRDTPPSHSQRIYAALPGTKRLILVSGAGHNQSLGGPVWTDIEAWVDSAVKNTRGRLDD